MGSIPGSERSPGERNVNPFHILAWKIPWTEELRGLEFMGSQTVRHSLATKEQHIINAKYIKIEIKI